MKQKRNDLWRLDLLETKFFKALPRLSTTKKLINARKNSQVLKKLPHSRAEAHKQIVALKSEILHKKWHGYVSKLQREVTKKVKLDSRSWKEETLTSFFGSQEKIKTMINARLVKIFISSILNTKELKTNPPEYVDGELRSGILDKSHPNNPSRFFIDHCQSDKVLNQYISKLWNTKPIKKICDEAEWSFKKIRGNLTSEERTARAHALGRDSKTVADDEDEGGEDSSEDESEGEDANEDEDSDNDSQSESGISDSEIRAHAEEDSDDNDSDSTGSSEPPSREKLKEAKEKAKKATEEKKKKEKFENLPSLAVGYFSGESDDEEDVDNDKVAKEATTQRKNRRGQRARQKIWEQKYGKRANHVAKERQRVASEREQKQKEFEERQRKRELKAQQSQNSQQQAYQKSYTKDSDQQNSGYVHPSWEAKRKAEEKLKNLKFTGKKMKFD